MQLERVFCRRFSPAGDGGAEGARRRVAEDGSMCVCVCVCIGGSFDSGLEQKILHEERREEDRRNEGWRRSPVRGYEPGCVEVSVPLRIP